MTKKNKFSGPKVLLFDVETAPILAYVWGIWDQTVGLNQIKSDWHLLSWSAKWLKDKNGNVYGPHNDIMYMDQRSAANIEDDKRILKGIWKLLDEADVVITQNGKSFDVKKLNARFVMNGMKPPSSFKHIDTRQIAKKHFGFTSNKLEYMTDKLNKKYKKQKHKRFSGFELWVECIAGNNEAWEEMKTYNIYDVLSLEELYNTLIPWDNTINFNLYRDSAELICICGSTRIVQNGHSYTSVGKFKRYKCGDCGAEVGRDRTNLLSKQKRKSIKVRIAR